MCIGNRTFNIFTVPCYVIMSCLVSSDRIVGECIMEILPDVYAREDTFCIDAEPVTLIDSEIRSSSDVVLIGLPCSLHLLKHIVTGCLYVSLKAGVHHIIFIFRIVTESV